MQRWFVAASVLLLLACGSNNSTTTSGSGGSAPKQQTAQSVADNSADFPGLPRCPESGTYVSYLRAEQTKNPDQYTVDNKDWTDLKAGGADDGYVVVYAANTSDCGQFGGNTPSGKLAYVYVVRFKNATSASTMYKSQLSQFHMSDADVNNLKAAGGTVKQGATTGLGDNSLVVSVDVQSVSFYIALWENRTFEVAVLVYNLLPSVGSTAANNINSRIR